MPPPSERWWGHGVKDQSWRKFKIIPVFSVLYSSESSYPHQLILVLLSTTLRMRYYYHYHHLHFFRSKITAWFPRPEALGNMAVTGTRDCKSCSSSPRPEVSGTVMVPVTRWHWQQQGTSDLGGTSTGNKHTSNATGKEEEDGKC